MTQALSISAVVLDGVPPLVKQLPVVVLFAVALGITAAVPTVAVSSLPALLWAVAILAVATGVAAVLPRVDPRQRWVLVVPAIDFVVIGVLRFATGEGASIFASMAILPAVWIAASPGRRHVALAFVLVCGGLLVPFLLGSTLENNPNEIARGLFTASAFTLAAAVVNDLARLARDRIADIHAREQLVLTELEQASAVQRALQPKDALLTDYDFAGFCLPAKVIGGDFFDWYPTRSGTAFTLGDVMGKGVGAGIVAATLRAVVRSARNHDDLSIALERASECLASDLADASTFATMFHARLDESTGIVRYIDAGHGLTLHVRADGSWDRLTSFNLPVGIASDDAWATTQLHLQPGDTLISCSDGILDVFDGTVESLRFVAAEAVAATNAADAVGRLRGIMGATELPDDVTFLVLRRPAV
jgi:sigma-B regulation protein RsbU (phosphoserine phosphatase)